MSVRKTVKITWIVIGSLTLLLVLFILSVSINLFGLYGKIPGLEVLENPKNEVASEVYSSDFVLMGKYYSHFNRTPVEYKDLPPHLVNALIATEDVRFYKHSGIDFKGLIAIPAYILTGSKRGSSTLTQQLAKNLFRLREAKEYQGPLSNNMVVIKAKEWITAIRLEQAYTKQEILLMYLNTVNFGGNIFGIKSASTAYFNKAPDKLTVEEAAVLIGMLKGTSLYNPRKYPERAQNRRNTVLSQMEKYGYLTEEQLAKLEKIPMKLKYTALDENNGIAPYFRAYLKDFLHQWCYDHGRNLQEDGLRIFTTIDSRLQNYAEAATAKHMKFLQKEFFAHWKGRKPWTDENHKEIKGFIEKIAKRSERYKQLKQEHNNDEAAAMKEMNKPVKMRVFTWNGGKDTTMSPMDSIRYALHFLHAGMMAMDPNTGQIKAWVGDIDYRYFKYDHVKQGRRQPGSAFKPLIYAYAINKGGFTPCTKVLDVPVTFNIGGGKTWTPKNSHGGFSGREVTLKQALAESMNSVTARLMMDYRPEEIVDFAKTFGITSPLDAVPTLCLGTSDVTVYELTGAYSVFVNKGTYYRPVFITRIEDKDGNVLEEFVPEHKNILSEEAAYAMVEMLKATTEEAGGTAVSLKSTYGLNFDVGGKTGTTQGNSDGWFVGISPNLVCGVWVGGEHRSIRFRTMTLGQGAKMALPIFGYFMQNAAKEGATGKEFPKPANMTMQTDCEMVDLHNSAYTDSSETDPSLPEQFNKPFDEFDEQQ